MFLSQFDIKLKHVPGKKLVMADMLSRLSHLDDSEHDNEDIVMLPDEVFVNAVEIPIIDRIKDT